MKRIRQPLSFQSTQSTTNMDLDVLAHCWFPTGVRGVGLQKDGEPGNLAQASGSQSAARSNLQYERIGR